MKQIGLVSSINGLGHARRLTQLALSLNQIGYQSILFATKKQINKLVPELNKLGKVVNYVEITSHGIDGPGWMRNGCLVESPSDNVIRLLHECDLVISDNSIWPIKFNSNFVLFGHFNWLNYWDIKDKQIFSGELKEIYLEEVMLLSRIKTAFQFKTFHFSGSFDPKTIIPIKLLKYESDKDFPKMVNSKSIWMSAGTTELNRYPYLNKIKKYKYKIEPIETFKLIGSAQKPLAVIGRPGLGTIRDCLAAGIIFIPYLSEYDPELNSNILSLKNLSLVSTTTSLSPLSFESDINEILSDKHMIDSWQYSWLNISESSSIVCEQILDLST